MGKRANDLPPRWIIEVVLVFTPGGIPGMRLPPLHLRHASRIYRGKQRVAVSAPCIRRARQT
jgi:hypothetical protein